MCDDVGNGTDVIRVRCRGVGVPKMQDDSLAEPQSKEDFGLA